MMTGTKSENPCVRLPKGSYAIAHIEKSAYHLHTGPYVWSRFYVIRVLKATREGRVKSFADNPVTSAEKNVDRHTTVFSLSEKYLAAAEKLFAQQPIDFTGYADKEHLRLALVNVDARST